MRRAAPRCHVLRSLTGPAPRSSLAHAACAAIHVEVTGEPYPDEPEEASMKVNVSMFALRLADSVPDVSGQKPAEEADSPDEVGDAAAALAQTALEVRAPPRLTAWHPHRAP